jgi:hypothetical protein
VNAQKIPKTHREYADWVVMATWPKTNAPTTDRSRSIRTESTMAMAANAALMAVMKLIRLDDGVFVWGWGVASCV